MTATVHALGQELLGPYRLGDGLGLLATPAAAALAVHYTIQQPGSAALPVTYTIEGLGQAALLVWYTIASPLQRCAINDVSTIPQPDTIAYTDPQAAGTDLGGQAVVQGYSTVTWSYQRLLDADIAALQQLYSPDVPEVLLTYPNELGFWTRKPAYWQPPSWGTRQTITHEGISLTFTHLLPD